MGYGQVWSCAIPECNHFMPRNMEARVLGKASICWKCNQQIVLDETNMENDKPICHSCSGKSSGLLDVLTELGLD